MTETATVGADPLPTPTPRLSTTTTPTPTSVSEFTPTPAVTAVTPVTPTPNSSPAPGSTPGIVPTPTTTPTPTPTIDLNLPSLPTRDSELGKPGLIAEADISELGGRIDAADGRLTIEIPDEAANERMRISIKHLDVKRLPNVDTSQNSGFHQEAKMFAAWELEAYAIDRDMAPIETFDSNIRIITNVGPEDMFGLNPGTIRLWNWSEAGQKWETVPVTPVPYSGIVVAEVDHFSVYSGTADPANPMPPIGQTFQTDLQTGASSVTYPIDVPQGRGGLQPNLTLSYDSNLPNEMGASASQGSWTGIGWDLNVGSIRKAFVDGGGTQYFLDLGGFSDELIPDPTNGNLWRTKRHDYLRIEEKGSCALVNAGTGQANPTPPCWWVVTDKQGTKYSFGGTIGADGDYARYYDYYWAGSGYQLYYYRWDLAKVEDTLGNDISYEYQQDGQIDTAGGGVQPWVYSAYPKKISYNDGKVEITFDLGFDSIQSGGYPLGPLRDDTPRNLAALDPPQCLSAWISPYRSGQTRRLDGISVRAEGSGALQAVRDYVFTYDTTDFTRWTEYCFPIAGEHTLKSVSVRGNDGSGELTRMDLLYSNEPVLAYSSAGLLGGYSRPFLEEASNGLGGTVTYDYVEKIVDPIPPGVGFWNRNVVDKMTSDEGITGAVPSVVKRYSYDDGPAYSKPSWLLQGQDWIPDQAAEYRGFGTVTEFHGPAGGDPDPYTVHSFHTTNYPLPPGLEDIQAGREKSTVAYDGLGVLWRQTDVTWNNRTLPSGCSGECAHFIFVGSVEVYTGPSLTVDAALKTTTNYEYDTAGNLVLEVQKGVDTTGEDDRTIWRPHHVPTTIANPTFLEDWIMLPQFERIYQGSSGNLAYYELVSPLGESETAFYYDGSWSYIAAPSVGMLTGVHRNLGETNTYYEYDSYGNLTAQSVPTDISIYPGGSAQIPAGVAKTTWSYDPSMRVFPTSTTNPEGHTTTFLWDQRMATLLERHEPSGNDIITQYDIFGRPTIVYDDFTSAAVPATMYEYDWASTHLNRTVTRSLLDGSTYTWEVHCSDGFGREVQVRRSHTSANDSVLETSYNEQGLVAYNSEPFSYPTNQNCTEPDTPFIDKTLYAYNPLSEVTQITNPDGIPSYRNRVFLDFEEIDEKGHKTKLFHDALGRLTKVEEFTGTSAATYSVYAETQYDRDVLDNLVKVTDDAGNVTLMFYDALGRRTDLMDPDLGHQRYSYDVAGNLIEQLDARDEYVSMQYDALNRLTRKCYTASPCSSGSAVATYTYDSYDGGVCSTPSATGVGQLTKMVDDSGTARWCFDARGREVKESRVIDGTTYDVSRTYNQADQLKDLTYPDGEVMHYYYDSTSGQPNALGSFVTSASYYAGFRPASITMGYGTPTTYDYDALGRVTDIENLSRQDLHYEYDIAGNVEQISDAAPAGGTVSFTYDDLDRLRTASGVAYSAVYEYDSIGNMTRIQEDGSDLYPKYGVGSRPHAVHVVDNSSSPSNTSIVAAYQYDASGNMIGAEDTNAGLVDSDGDACQNAQERDTTTEQGEASCGNHDPANYWDRYDVNHDGVIDLLTDILGVVQRYNPDGVSEQAIINSHTDPLSPAPAAPAYHPAFDRGDPADRSPADGVIDLLTDILGVIQQHDPDTAAQPIPFSTTYEYDAENRLTKQTVSGVETEYFYDGLGALAKKTSGGVTTVYIDNIYEKTGGTVGKYYFFNGQRIAKNQNGLFYLLADHLGSTTTTLSSTGTVLASQQYYPFGGTRPSSDPMVTDKLFTGHQQEGDLYYMRARFYRPDAGRFLQPDSIVPDYTNPQSLNRYSYVLNNPLAYTDPTGHCGFSANDARSNNLLGLCGPGTNRSYGISLPTHASGWPGNTYSEQHGGRGILDRVRIALGDFGAGTLPVAGEVCGGIEAATGRSCFGDSLTWQERGISAGFIFVPFIGSSMFRSGDEAADALNAGKRALQGGEITDTFRGGNLTITFKHGGRHATELGLNVGKVNQAIADDVAMRAAQAPGGGFYGIVRVDGIPLEYRAHVLPDGTINVGTYREVDY